MTKLLNPYLLAAFGLLTVVGGVVWAARPDGPYSGYEITWLGDTLSGDAAEPFLLENGYGWAFAEVGPVGGADLTVLNLEGPITTLTDQWNANQRWHYNALPASATALAELGIDVASLGNNHSLDRGPAGLTDTTEALQAVGISTIGAGPNADVAGQPFIVDTPYGRVGIFSFTKQSSTAPDAVEIPGIYALNTANLFDALEDAKTAKVDWLVAFVGWGVNYSDIVPAQREWARRLADAGFDLVVGTGPHSVQPIELIGRTPIVYSIGNFVFGTPGRWTEEHPGFGLIVTTVLGPRGFRELRVECIQTDNAVVAFQPRACDSVTAGQVLGSLSADLHMEGELGVIRW